jgi:Flp pilus assembly protein TadG
VVESAIILFTFLVIVMGMIDLAMYQLRANMLTEACRQGVRAAIVHGSISPRPAGDTSWGPTQIGPVNGNDGSAAVQAIKPFLYGIDPTSVTITITWPDAGNDPTNGNRVNVAIDGSYSPMITFVFSGSIPIHATSMMPIAH